MVQKLRFLGFALAWVAFCLLAGPLEVAVDCIPCIGPMLGNAVSAITCCVPRQQQKRLVQNHGPFINQCAMIDMMAPFFGLCHVQKRTKKDKKKNWHVATKNAKVSCIPATACTMGVVGVVWLAMRPMIGIPLIILFVAGTRFETGMVEMSHFFWSFKVLKNHFCYFLFGFLVLERYESP